MPKVAGCTIGDAGCICHDPRLSTEKQDYILTFEQCKNYIATNIDDYMLVQEWMQRNCR